MHRPKWTKLIVGMTLLIAGSSFLWGSGANNYRLTSLGVLEKRVGNRWIEPKAEGLALRWVYPFSKQEKRPLTGVGSTVTRPDQVLVTTSDEIYLSEDGGETFRLIINRNRISYVSYFTSVAVSETNPDEWVVGTSFNGFHLTKDGGKTWRKVRGGLSSLFFGAAYYETVNDVVFSQADPNKIYFAYGVNGNLALYNLETEKIELTTQVPEPRGILTLSIETKNDAERLTAQTSGALWILEDNQWRRLTVYRAKPLSREALARRKQVENRRGIYLTAWTASNLPVLRKHFEFIKAHGMDTVVIDFKDDSGWVMWESDVDIAKQAKAVRPILDVKAIRELADEFGIHIIARFVVFKDKKLYNFNNNKYALWDRKRQAPWAYFSGEEKTQKEFWVDLFSPEVWSYNLSLAKELEALGVDEIQFDYIRFPSDGPIDTISSHHNTREMKNVDALESFLKQARESLNLPISTDIFGYNGWFLTDALGQNMDRISLYVDAISPMSYPSHYDESFLGQYNYMERAYLILKQGSDRAEFYTKGRTVIRQYVQAFLLAGERNFGEATYLRYLNNQIKGVEDSMGSGWILWNASNNYYMVVGDLSKTKRENN